ncbi:MAG: helix-turn-helix domain-containing protein [Armatimonadetes bacterium]|nr:helix-turn-helix domain-containing protein [Armatimonadota bacterium]
MTRPKSLGEILREARAAKGLSLRGLAGQMDITPSYLSDIENDRRVPAEEVLQQLASLLNLGFDDLMAQAGRFGEEAEQFAKDRPAAVKLFRRLANANPSDEAIEKIIGEIEDLSES